MIVGLQGFRPYLISIGSDAHVGWASCGRSRPSSPAHCWSGGCWRWRAAARWPHVSFPVYLTIVGLEAAVAYALTRDLSMFTFRYGLLALFLPVGGVALVMQQERPIAMRIDGRGARRTTCGRGARGSRHRAPAGVVRAAPAPFRAAGGAARGTRRAPRAGRLLALVRRDLPDRRAGDRGVQRAAAHSRVPASGRSGQRGRGHHPGDRPARASGPSTSLVRGTVCR